jgi:hypothetical protein
MQENEVTQNNNQLLVKYNLGNMIEQETKQYYMET